MQQLQSKILTLWQAERPRWILWLPVFLGIGVGMYFALEHEPPLAWSTALPIAAVCMAIFLRKKPVLMGLCILLACVSLGAALGAWRTHIVAAPVITESLYPQMMEGTVSDITQRSDSTRLTLGDVHIPDLTSEETPAFVTVSLREHADKAVTLGDRVRIKAGFFPPPKPVIPGGYAFNRHFYFLRIGATGYAAGKIQPEILQQATEQGGAMATIAHIRHYIARYMMEHMGMREGAIAAALMVGEGKAIPEDIYEAMRQSGLVHVLSISGMHLSLAAGILFFSMRLVLAVIPRFATRYDGKKVAAAAALLGSFGYLLLAGLPISAQRSFVMVALVLLAVMLSRNVTPIRSLCLAAVVILVIAPESLLNPGFQLSFAATLGILAYYEHWREQPRSTQPEEWTWRQKQWRFWGGIIATSVIATLATTPYILHHFEDLPVYSVLANLLVMPLVSFWIMPLVVLILLLLPFGLADWLLPLLQGGLWLMHRIAEWVVSLPLAVITLPPLSTTALVVVTLGGLWLCLWQQKWRHLGWVPVILGLASLAFYHPPDVVISADGKKVAIRHGEGKVAMLRGQRSGFAQDGWLRFMQAEQFDLRREVSEDILRCDDLGCIYKWQSKEIAVVAHRAALLDCATADLTLAPHWSAYYDAKRLCPDAMLFDRSWFQRVDGMVFWLEDDGIRYLTVAETLGHRPWSGLD